MLGRNMKAGDLHLQSRLRLGTALLAVTLAGGSLSACTTVEKGWTSTKEAVGGMFGGDDEKAAPPDQTAEADAATDATTEAAADTPADTTSAPTTGGLLMGSQSAASLFRPSTPQAPLTATVPEPTPPAADEKPAPKKSQSKRAAKAEEPQSPKDEAAKAEPAQDEPAKNAKTEQPKKNIEGLVADTEKAAYTETTGRRPPVTVRPLNESAQTAEAAAPPRPVAAPVEPVTRLQGELAPASPATSSTAANAASGSPASGSTASGSPASSNASAPAPRAAELAERLDAPAPTPSPSIPDAPARAPAAATPSAPSAPTQVAAVPPAPQPASAQPLIPAAPRSQIADYGDDTVLVDSSGTKGGRNVLGPPLASVGSAGFDPGNSSVSSEVGTVTFAPGSATISAQGKAILADAARLRAQTDGALRVVGRGDQAVARAAAVSRELRRLGVPATRLYDGGADSTVLGDAADIYLDY
jgi:outer membrane protein OmpA-like peptidoglycan-associated protein